MTETTHAFLLRLTKLTDTSLIVTWFTHAHGKIKTVAKGARRPKSPFAGKLDLFFGCEITFIRSAKSELHILKEVALREPFDGLRADYSRVLLASYFAELTDLATESDHSAPDLFDLLSRAFAYLNRSAADKRALLHFEFELCRLLGLRVEKKQSPAMALGHTCGRLPPGRAELLRRLA
jgi:DNA repair protein RecO (recombination protein O)